MACTCDRPRKSSQQARVGRGDPPPVEVRDGRAAAPAGTASRKVEGAKPSAHDLLGRRAGVEQHVEAGDADVEGARADVDRDVAGPQEEELDVVGLVGHDEVAQVGRRRR